ncbi:MAG: zinc ribbon domain-containing protein [Bacteroidota bacterium]|nr:zinc ribbon domain-containing protein [Bacteroidota bacterium]
MPTYEYQCKNCNHHFEEWQAITAKPLVECPNCHTPNLVRLIGGGGGMIFKGSGFYLTDYKKSSGSSSSTKPTNGLKKESAKTEKEAAKKTTETKSEGKGTGAKKE